ncbi:MAG: glycosyltransferase [Microgenomates group bacterium]
MINKEDNHGGAAQMAWNLAAELRKMGHEVRFIVRRKFSDSGDVHELNENPLLKWLKIIFRRDFTIVLSSLRDQIMSNDLRYGIEEEIVNHEWLKWADVVHFHNLHGNYFKLENIIKISKIKKVVWTLHDLWAVTGRCAYPFECNGFENKCGTCPNLINYQKMLRDNSRNLLVNKNNIYNKSKLNLVVPSDWMAGNIKKSILNKKKCVVITNAIDPSVYKPLNDKRLVRDELGLPIDKKIIIYFGYGEKNVNKGWRQFEKVVDYYKNNQNVFFLIIGVKNTVSNNQMKFVEMVYDKEMLVKYYNCGDMLLYPSLSESFGMVPLEAVACGILVVAFPVGVIPELIEHKKNGYIAKYRDDADLINGVDFILNNKFLRMPKLKDKFIISNMAKEYINSYENA